MSHPNTEFAALEAEYHQLISALRTSDGDEEKVRTALIGLRGDFHRQLLVLLEAARSELQAVTSTHSVLLLHALLRQSKPDLPKPHVPDVLHSEEGLTPSRALLLAVSTGHERPKGTIERLIRILIQVYEEQGCRDDAYGIKAHELLARYGQLEVRGRKPAASSYSCMANVLTTARQYLLDARHPFLISFLRAEGETHSRENGRYRLEAKDVSES